MSVQDGLERMPDRVEIDAEKRIARTRRQIGKSGNSYVVRIPPQLLEAASMSYEDSVELIADMDEGTITIRREHINIGD